MITQYEENYLEIVHEVIHHGNDYNGRGTIAHRRGLWQVQNRVRLSAGATAYLPVITVRKPIVKWAAEELRWMLSGSTFEPHLTNSMTSDPLGLTIGHSSPVGFGPKIWSDWATAEKCAEFGRKPGDLGEGIYGYQWRSSGEWSLLKLEPRPKVAHSPAWEQPYRDRTFDATRRSGFCVLDGTERAEGRRTTVEIKFHRTGTIRRVRKDWAENQWSEIKDPWEPSVVGVGYLGDTPPESASNLYAVWASMLERCYAPTCGAYANYGGRGVRVCRRWHCFSAFVADAKTLPGWADKQRSTHEVELDKDHRGDGLYYSPGTCTWVPQAVNAAYIHARPFLATSPEGSEYYHQSIPAFAEAHGLRPHSVNRCLRGVRKLHKGWSFRPTEDRGLRFSGPVDQLARLVEGLEKNPFGTRHILSAWSPKEADKVHLPPCHTLMQFRVHKVGGTMVLDSALYQRSADLILGVPTNMTFYCLLTHIIAKALGYTPGVFVHNMADAHIYGNQLDEARAMLTRKPLGAPELLSLELEGATPLDRVLNFTYGQLKLSAINHHEGAALEVSV